MCGIAGILHCNETKRVKRMLSKIKYRGPDDSDIFEDAKITMGHNRLTIIDLVNGRQPLGNENGRYWLIFNGEIYNYLALRKELKNHKFNTESDSEVIIHLYEELKERCVNYLDGMFAFVIYDTKKKTIFAARDPLGIKPIYYGKTDDHLFSHNIWVLCLMDL